MTPSGACARCAIYANRPAFCRVYPRPEDWRPITCTYAFVRKDDAYDTDTYDDAIAALGIHSAIEALAPVPCLSPVMRIRLLAVTRIPQ